ncbi:MAG: hypothetical protein ACLQDY_03670 [Streptosporangiaceae bacterium]
MSERDIHARGGADQPSGQGLPTTTGEFRATPDISASTAQFRAFAAGPEGEHAWSMRASGRNVLALTAAIIAVVIVLIVLAFVVLGH